jgi:hypothetical protein
MRSVVPAARSRPTLSPPCSATVASLSRVFAISGSAGSSFLVNSTSSRVAARSGYSSAAAAAVPDPFGGRPDPFANRPSPIANKRATSQEKVETYIRDDFHLKPLEVVTNEVCCGSASSPVGFDQLLFSQRLDLKPFVLQSHRRATSVLDSLALLVVKSAGSMARRFFGKRYGHGAVVMETVSPVLPMVAAVCLHLSSLRTGQHQTLGRAFRRAIVARLSHMSCSGHSYPRSVGGVSDAARSSAGLLQNTATNQARATHDFDFPGGLLCFLHPLGMWSAH